MCGVRSLCMHSLKCLLRVGWGYAHRLSNFAGCRLGVCTYIGTGLLNMACSHYFLVWAGWAKRCWASSAEVRACRAAAPPTCCCRPPCASALHARRPGPCGARSGHGQCICVFSRLCTLRCYCSHPQAVCCQAPVACSVCFWPTYTTPYTLCCAAFLAAYCQGIEVYKSVS